MLFVGACSLPPSELNDIIISNRIGSDSILSTDEDSIYFDNVFYYNKNDTSLCVLGNLLGGKSSLFVELNERRQSIVMSEQSAKIDSIQYLSLDGHKFILVYREYADMCAEQISLSIYYINGSGLEKCFDDIKKQVYIGADYYCSDALVSFDKSYNIEYYKGKMTININKENEDGIIEKQKRIVKIKQR